jgi:hypothetical protein
MARGVVRHSVLLVYAFLPSRAFAGTFGSAEGSISALGAHGGEAKLTTLEAKVTKLEARIVMLEAKANDKGQQGRINQQDGASIATGAGATAAGCLSKKELGYLCSTNPVPTGYDAHGVTKGILFVYEDDYYSGFFAMITDVLNQFIYGEETYGGSVAPVVLLANKKYAMSDGCSENMWDQYFLPASTASCDTTDDGSNAKFHLYCDFADYFVHGGMWKKGFTNAKVGVQCDVQWVCSRCAVGEQWVCSGCAVGVQWVCCGGVGVLRRSWCAVGVQCASLSNTTSPTLAVDCLLLPQVSCTNGGGPTVATFEKAAGKAYAENMNFSGKVFTGKNFFASDAIR